MIQVDHISKQFKLYARPSLRLKEIITRRKQHQSYQALDDVCLSVSSGETLGIIGFNGAGKSTLLKVITGIILPDTGQVTINGKVTGLLELGTGFNPEVSGLENIYMNGSLLGMSHDELEQREKVIIDFAELGLFIHEPLKTYSSGMIMRLAFAIAIHADPACFVIDEALSVGDANFQQKCIRKINEFKDQGGSIIFVSHDLNAVKVLCDQVILLDSGKVVLSGTPDDVVNHYNLLLSQKNHVVGEFQSDQKQQSSYGTFDAEIESIQINDSCIDPIIISGSHVCVKVCIKANQSLDELTSGLVIRDKYGQDIFGTNTFKQSLALSIEKGSSYIVEYDFDMNLGAGKYTIGAAIQKIPTAVPKRLHWVDNQLAFEVVSRADDCFSGLVNLSAKISIEKLSA